MLRQILRASRARRLHSTAPPPPTPPPPAAPSSLFERLRARLLPPDPPELAAWKAREARIVRAAFGRSRLADARAAGAARKPFVAPPAVVAPLAANAFPPVALTRLSDGAPGDAAGVFASARATLVTLAYVAHGQAQLPPWTAVALPALGARPAFAPPLVAGAAAAAGLPPAGAAAGAAAGGVQHLNILYLQGWFFRVFAPVVLRGAATAAGAGSHELHATGVAIEPSARAADHWADALRVDNRLMGHVFLVDAAGVVRWQAAGPPAEGEADNLVAAARLLLAEARARGR